LPAKWIMSRLNTLITNVQKLFDLYQYGEAGNQILSFMWDEFAPWYLEIAKHPLYNGTEEEKIIARRVMVHVLDTCLRLLHPFMPYMTEEAWKYIPHEGDALIIAKWPEADAAYIDEQAEAQMNNLFEMIRAIREVRTEYNVEPGKRIQALVAPGSQRDILSEYNYVFARLCNVEQTELIADDAVAPDNSASTVIADTTIYLPLEGMLDIAKECERLRKELADNAANIQRVQGKLSNDSFVSKAPEQVVQRERDRLAEYESEAQKIQELLDSLCG
ncbi:MAG: class I tRNA ligase family protein, partial [Anaerolineae bacterium]|nr:class I tRNA ligase family protein [Anaerolineae bacterium]